MGYMPAVSFQSVSKTYRTPKGDFQALNSVSLDIEEGEFFGLLGPNGAGKTTMISILAGLARASGGRVLVPQELVFDPFFNVREALQFQSGYFGVKNNDDWIDELLYSLGLTDKAHSNMRQLSGGMKRRVLVAQALVHKPPIIVLDEPTAGVDVELRQTLWHFIAKLNKQGHTVLLTTHYLEEAEALCSRVAMLKRGEIIKLSPMSELLKSASSNVLQFKTDSALPKAVADRARVTGRIVQIPAAHAGDVEQLLAALRQGGVTPEDVEIRRADLEDVFIHIMNEGSMTAAAAGGVA